MPKIEKAFVEIAPTDPNYRKLITAAIRSKDHYTLNALKGKVGLPIHFVNSWFMYSLMTDEHDLSDVVVIWSPQVRADFTEFSANLAKQEPYYLDDDEEVDADEPEVPPLTIPLDTYKFLE